MTLMPLHARDLLLDADAAAAAAALARAVHSGEVERHACQVLEAALRHRSYARGWLPGGTQGELAAELARSCGHLAVTPGSPEAAASIERRCAHLANVGIESGTSPFETGGVFDLIVVSGFDRFERADEAITAARRVCAHLAPRGELIALHALAPAHAHLHGDAVHHLLLAHLPLQWQRGDRDGEFRIDVWRRA